MDFDLKALTKEITGTFQTLISQIFEPIFSAVQNTLYHQASYTIILLVVIFWLFKLLKTGYPTREELFEAGKWVGLVCFIYAIFYSYAGYIEFIKLLSLPANWLRNATSIIFDGELEPLEMIAQAFTKSNQLLTRLYHRAGEMLTGESAIQMMISTTTLLIPGGAIYKAIIMLGYISFPVLLWLTTAILIIGILAIIMVSGFMALLILSIAPVMIPLLFNKNLRAYFFSWLKLYISYSLYVPLALIVLGLVVNSINSIIDIPQTEIKETITGFWDFFAFCFKHIVFNCICIYLLLQIPNWVSQVMGVQGLNSGGVGAGVATMAGAGVVGLTGGAGGIAGGMLAKAQGGSALAGMMKGGLGAMAKNLPGAKTIEGAVKSVRGGKNGDAIASTK